MRRNVNPNIRKRLDRIEGALGGGSRLVILAGEDARDRLKRWKAGEAVDGIRGSYRGGPLLVVIE